MSAPGRVADRRLSLLCSTWVRRATLTALTSPEHASLPKLYYVYLIIVTRIDDALYEHFPYAILHDAATTTC